MSYKIEALPPFAKEVKYLAKRYKSLKEDILRLRDELLENPLSGTDLGGGLRKVRMSIHSKSQGKRGGARVITFTVLVSVDEGTYDKSEIESMSVKEIRKLLDKCDLK
ncbi:addiction module toxin RelE [Parabacteroides distasonis]|jgi:mRNA-degrading endonuclease RelE of RelBE toxin-antitoxin system|uniref:addiction module toxin RelE n=1 Tax=Parabacteroides distasonis TaxID=823 RepID=UPI0022E8335C|nr:addiction module toxin RelE [Parabacteroides distasonis]